MSDNLNDIYSQVGELRGRLVTTEAHVNSMLSHFEKRFDKVDDRLTKQAEVSALRHEKVEVALNSIKDDVSKKVDERFKDQEVVQTKRHEDVVMAISSIKDDLILTKAEARHDKGFVLGAFAGSSKAIGVIFAGLLALSGFIAWAFKWLPHQ